MKNTLCRRVGSTMKDNLRTFSTGNNDVFLWNPACIPFLVASRNNSFATRYRLKSLKSYREKKREIPIYVYSNNNSSSVNIKEYHGTRNVIELMIKCTTDFFLYKDQKYMSERS